MAEVNDEFEPLIEEVRPISEEVIEAVIEEKQPLIQYIGEQAEAEVKAEAEVQIPIEEPVLSDDEKLKQNYLKELEAAQIKDKLYVENLMYMMNMGYYNFRVNFNLLTRNNNDLIIAVNKLCNHMITDSIFEAK